MQPASLLRRIAAILYDALLLLALLFLATVPFIALRQGDAVEPSNRLYQLTLLAVISGFFIGYWSTRGRTLGMQSWGLQLQNDDGRIPTVAACTVRLLAAVLSTAALGLGFLWQLWDKDRLTWHDRLSRTRLMHYPKKQH